MLVPQGPAGFLTISYHQDQLCNFQDLLQNENAKPLIKKSIIGVGEVSIIALQYKLPLGISALLICAWFQFWVLYYLLIF